MPTYTYRCKKCRNQFEYFQSIIDKPLEVCPSCGGKLERVITGGSGLIFKGSGFYITDYKNKNFTGHTSSKNNKKSKNKENTKEKP